MAVFKLSACQASAKEQFCAKHSADASVRTLFLALASACASIEVLVAVFGAEIVEAALDPREFRWPKVSRRRRGGKSEIVSCDFQSLSLGTVQKLPRCLWEKLCRSLKARYL